MKKKCFSAPLAIVMVLCALLAIVMVLSLSACGKKSREYHSRWGESYRPDRRFRGKLRPDTEFDGCQSQRHHLEQPQRRYCESNGGSL